MERIIRLAIEGGFIYGHKHGEYTNDYLVKLFLEQKEKVLMNPEFYKALGRQQGWGDSCHHFESSDWFEYKHKASCNKGKALWQIHKARALAANDDGGRAEDYLNSIIK